MAPSLGSREDSRSRTSNCPSPPGTRAPAASLGASQKATGPRPATRAALCQGVQSPGPNAGPAAALPAPWARAHAGWVSRRARLFTQERKAPPQPGRGSAADYSPAGLPAGWHRQFGSPSPGRTPVARPPGSAQKRLCTLRHRLPPRPIQVATKFLSAQRAAQLTWESGHKRAEPEEAGVQGRRGPRHGGGARPQRPRRRRTARGPASQAGARGPRAGGCSRMPRAQPGLTAPGAGREAVAAALARALPPPSLPQRSQLSPGAAAALARRPGRLECRRSGRPGRAVLPGEGPAPRYGRNLDSGTRPALRLPRAPAQLCPSPPPLPFLPPARQAPLSSLLPPSLLSPSRPPPGCHTVSLRRGGAGRGELRARPAPPCAGTGPGQEAEGAQVEVSSRAHLGWGFEIDGSGLAGLARRLGATGRGRGALHQGLL